MKPGDFLAGEEPGVLPDGVARHALDRIARDMAAGAGMIEYLRQQVERDIRRSRRGSAAGLEPADRHSAGNPVEVWGAGQARLKPHLTLHRRNGQRALPKPDWNTMAGMLDAFEDEAQARELTLVERLLTRRATRGRCRSPKAIGRDRSASGCFPTTSCEANSGAIGRSPLRHSQPVTMLLPAHRLKRFPRSSGTPTGERCRLEGTLP